MTMQRWTVPGAKQRLVLSGQGVAAVAGESTMATKALDALDSGLAGSSLHEITTCIEKLVRPVQFPTNLPPQHPTGESPTCEVVVAAWIEGKPALFLMGKDGQCIDARPHDLPVIAIGSAAAYVVAWCGLWLSLVTDLKSAKVIGLRIAEEASVHVAHIVGPMTVFVITEHGASEMSQDEIEAVLELIDEWRERELDAFRSS